MAAIAITYTRIVLPAEGQFKWTAAATFAGESLTATSTTKNDAKNLLVQLILLARQDDTVGETIDL